MEAVERIRDNNPMWGKAKIVVLLAREGMITSESTFGRILKSLMERGVVTPVPTLRRKPGGRRFRLTGRELHTPLLPKGMKPTRPGELVQVDTLFVNVAPSKAVKHFTAYDPVATWTVGLVAGRATAACATALLNKLLAEAPFPVSGIQVDGGSEFRADFEQACQDLKLNLFVLPPKRPQLNGCVERAQGSWRYEFYACFDLPSRLDRPSPSSTPSPTGSTTTGLTRPLADGPQPNTCPPSAPKNPNRLRCAERGQMLEVSTAIVYVLWTGRQWKVFPKERPPESTVSEDLVRGTRTGTLGGIYHALFV